MLKVVIDTNVIVSAILGPSSVPALVLNAWRQKTFQLWTSTELLEELEEVLSRRHFFRGAGLPAEKVESLLADMEFASFVVVPEAGYDRVSADPDDDVFLVVAELAKADVIVSGDKHLLSIGQHKGIKILKPKDFLDSLSQSPL